MKRDSTSLRQARAEYFRENGLGQDGGYDRRWAEIGAWELASGCADYHAAWLLNIGAVALGVLLAPRRVWRALVRGRHCENLYHGALDAHWLDDTVGGLRQRLGLLHKRGFGGRE
jgi:hypothetical protein